MKLDILAIGAHPDDVELGAGASIAKEIKSGKKAAIVDLSKGELGTRGNEVLRSQEANKASEILGVSFRHNLGLKDGFINDDEQSILKLIQIIRLHQPEVVLINSIEDRHPDHAAASKLASRACFLSGLVKIKTQYDGVEQNAWRPKSVYSYIQWKILEPDFVVDVSEFMDKKMQAVLAYSSQFYNADSKEKSTPISTPEFIESLKNVAAEYGRIAGVRYAEGFKVEKYLCVDSFFDFK